MGYALWSCARCAEIRSEPLGPQQRVGQVKQQACGDQTGERIVENHDRSPPKRFRAKPAPHLMRGGYRFAGRKPAKTQTRPRAMVYPFPATKNPRPRATMTAAGL